MVSRDFRRRLRGISDLTRREIAARAVLCHLSACHHGLSLSAVGRQLSISRPSVARAVERAPAVFAQHGCTPDDFLEI